METFAEHPRHQQLSDANAPLDGEWFMELERGIETGNMSHLWDLKRHREDLSCLGKMASQLLGPVGENGGRRDDSEV